MLKKNKKIMLYRHWNHQREKNPLWGVGGVETGQGFIFFLSNQFPCLAVQFRFRWFGCVIGIVCFSFLPSLKANAPAALSQRDTDVSCLKACWDALKGEKNSSFLTVVTSSFPTQKVRNPPSSPQHRKWETFFPLFVLFMIGVKQGDSGQRSKPARLTN